MTQNVQQDTVRVNTPHSSTQETGATPSLGALTVVGVFNDSAALERAYRDVVGAGVTDNAISVVRQGQDAAPPMSSEDTKAGQGTVSGGVAGAVLGGIAGLALLAIPGIGPLLAAGPIAAVLGGVVTGGAMGALAGSFAGLGIPTKDAEEYESAVRRGGTFISVKTENTEDAERIAALLRQHGAENVSSFQPAL